MTKMVALALMALTTAQAGPPQVDDWQRLVNLGSTAEASGEYGRAAGVLPGRRPNRGDIPAWRSAPPIHFQRPGNDVRPLWDSLLTPNWRISARWQY